MHALMSGVLKKVVRQSQTEGRNQELPTRRRDWTACAAVIADLFGFSESVGGIGRRLSANAKVEGSRQRTN